MTIPFTSRTGPTRRPRPPLRGLSDRLAIVLAIGACAGAWAAIPGLAVVGAAAVVVAFWLRRPWLLIIGVVCVTSGLAARATAGLVIEPGAWTGTVEICHVATTAGGDLHAEVRAGAHHLDLIPGAVGHRRVAGAQPGDRLVVSGRITPVDPRTARGRGIHIAGRLHPVRVAAGDRPRLAWRVAGTVRNAVSALGRPLPASQRALFEGFVLGDASGQSAIQRADFRASGLTHLLVASGENVAFVLILVTPVLLRVGLRTRWLVTIGVCALYALVTGLEPSVLRAATMAVVAATAAGVGRPVRSWRSLAFAVTVLVIADPFLVHSTAFGLSVGASVGILALARPLAAVLAGPLWVRGPLAVTVAAQFGVAPLLLGFPGGMPVAAVPANLLAAVPAGLVMVLGLPALVVVATGLPGTGVFLWVPRVMLGWVDTVARVTSAMSLGYLGAVTVLVATIGVAIVVAARHERLVWIRRLGIVMAVFALGAPVVFPTIGPGVPDASTGPVVVRRGSTVAVVLTGKVPTGPLLTVLSVRRVRGIDLVVVPHGDAADVTMLAAIGHRHRIGRVLSPRPPPDDKWPWTRVVGGEQITVGEATVQVVATIPVLSVHVAPARAARSHGR